MSVNIHIRGAYMVGMTTILAAFPWGTFWAAALVFVTIGGIIGAALTAVYTTRHVRRRRLGYRMEADRLLGAHSSLSGRLRCTLTGLPDPLADPHVVRLHLTNLSRYDIAADDFDSEEPIRLNVGVPILGLLGSSSVPATRATPTAQFQGAELRVGPGRLAGGGHTATYVVLVDKPPTLSCTHGLNNTDAEKVPAAASADTSTIRAVWLATLAVLVASVILVASNLFIALFH